MPQIKTKYTSGQPGHVLDATYYYYDTSPDFNQELAIVCGGYEQCAPDFEINRTNYPYFFVKYTLQGKGTLEIGSNRLSLKPGVLTGFAPGTAHHYIADAADPMRHIFITFAGNQAESLFRKSTLGERHILDELNQDETLAIFQKILHIGLNKPEYSQEICCNYLRILLLEQASAVTRSRKNFSISMKTYLECKKFIDTHFSSIKSPGQVAEECNIDVRYMSSLFKRYCHIPPNQYLMRLKLNKAAYLLLTTDLAVKEVAYQVGFSDPYHFSKSFRKFHGHSPQQYRQQHL